MCLIETHSINNKENRRIAPLEGGYAAILFYVIHLIMYFFSLQGLLHQGVQMSSIIKRDIV